MKNVIKKLSLLLLFMFVFTGTAFPQSIFFQEQFESGVPPTGWTVVDNEGTGVVWTTIAGSGEAGNFTNGSGEAACVSSDVFGPAEFDTELRTPILDFTNVTRAKLSFTANFTNFAGSDFFDVDVSTDGGTNWTNIMSWNEDHGGFRATPGEDVSLSISDLVGGQNNVVIRFHHYDPNLLDWDWYVQVDDLVITAAEFLVNPISGLTTTEAGGTATFQVSLNTQPSDDVTIDLSSSDTTEGTVSPASLTFSTGNWNTAQTVTVTGVDDSLADGNQAYTILTASAVSTDTDYSGLDPSDVTVSNVDDETGHTVTITKPGAGTGTVTSSPAGIDCGLSCSAYLLGGTTITLTATPDPGSAFDGFSGGGCSGNGECTFLLDQDYIITATFNPDSDSDGISDLREDGGPNGGDGNEDGTLDSLQANVATFQSITGSYVTLVSETGTSLTNVAASDNPSCADAPAACTYPQGFFGFTVTGVTPGAGTTVQVILHERDTTLSTYYKYGPTSDTHANHWYSFFPDGISGAVITQGATQTTIFLSFIDGQRGDDDLSANGEITDVGAPAVTTGGGGCFIATAAYGSSMERHVTILRKFRDRFLLANSAGKALMRLYYSFSPTMANALANHEGLRGLVRWGLLPLVGISWVMLTLGPLTTINSQPG